MDLENAVPSPANGNFESEGTIRLEPPTSQTSIMTPNKRKLDDRDEKEGEGDRRRKKGSAPIKEEFLINLQESAIAPTPDRPAAAGDDNAEAFHHRDRQPGSNNTKRREKQQGQNKNRKFGSSRDEVGLCSTRIYAAEFSPEHCTFGDRCRFDHDLRKYLAEHKRADLTTFGGLCPVWDLKGHCDLGWKCRFLNSHSKEIEHQDGRKELILVDHEDRKAKFALASSGSKDGTVNAIDVRDRISLTKKKFPTPKSELYIKWLNEDAERGSHRQDTNGHHQNGETPLLISEEPSSTSPPPAPEDETVSKADHRAAYKEPPLLPSEKRRLYFGAETPVLAPLTTQGNLPFRRLCTSLGAVFTYSEMAVSIPLLQGHKPEWALIKAHSSEIQSPNFTMKNSPNIVHDYNQSQDLRFGAQIAANKPWSCIKTTEVLTTLLPRGLRVIDLNVGCPIDLVYRDGAGSALMDHPAKLEKMLRGMNTVSNDVPITCKIRMGTKDKAPTAQKLVERLVLGGAGSNYQPCGVAAITLHGRSRQQRYTRDADWEYIAETAALIKRLNASADTVADTIREPDDRDLANTSTATNSKKNPVFFLGNGDVYSHAHYDAHIAHAGVDSVMVARGALIKPWIFEEITAGQYIDKTATERLAYVETFCRHGLQAWGSDEMGIGTTRRFLLEWLSFSCRYVPIGLLEYLPPSIQDRAPAYRGRNELETLMASDNCKDWLKISEMFLGPAHKDFRFDPKHKSNSYEIEAEG